MAEGAHVSATEGARETAPVPALFVVGPQRTGTSWLYEYFAAQPGVYLDRSRKENYFFDRSTPRSPAGDRRRLLSRFQGHGPPRLLVDVNPIYLGRRACLERLLAAFPEANVVYVRRDDEARRRSYRLHQEFNRPSEVALRLLGADNLYIAESDRLAQHDFEANEAELIELMADRPDRLLRLDHDQLATDGGLAWIRALSGFLGVELAPPEPGGSVYATRRSRGLGTRLAFVPVRVAQAAGAHKPVHRRRHRAEAAERGWRLGPLAEASPPLLARPRLRPRRILQVITRADTGGAQHHVLDLLTGLGPDHDLALAVGEEGPLTERARALGHRVDVVPELARSINPVRDRRAMAALGAVMADVEPDLVHAHSSKSGLVARLEARRRSLPSIFTAHGWVFAPNVPSTTRGPVWIAETVAGRVGDRVVCLSDHDRSLAQRWLRLPASAISVVPHGIAPEAPMADPASEPPSVLMAARLSAQKDHETLLAAVARLAHLDVTVRLAGDGPLRPELERQAERLGLGDRVQFLGDRHDMAELLASSQIFALISHYEGLPLSILEAMRAGLPVVATDVGGVADQVVDGVTGRLVGHRDVAGVAAAVEELVVDPARRVALGRAGRARFDERYRRDLMLARLRHLYDEVIEGRSTIDLRDLSPEPDPTSAPGASDPTPTTTPTQSVSSP